MLTIIYQVPRYKNVVSNVQASRSYVDSDGNEKTRELKSTASRSSVNVHKFVQKNYL